MNRFLIWSVFGYLLFLAGSGSAEQPATAGRKALDLLLAARYDEFSQLLTDEAKALLTPEFLRNRVGNEIKGFGRLEQIGEPLTAKSGTNDFISFPARFSGTTIDIQLTLNESGHVAGLHFRPPNEPLPPLWTRPSYSNPALFHERAVTVGDDQWKLGGTLTVPTGKGPYPGVVLVHGPGPNDRDESLFANRIFEDIAEGLSSKNIVVLRYDKRTKVYGAQMSETDFTLRDETIDDAVRAIALIRKQPEVDPARVFVLGHSLGGYALPRIVSDSAKQRTPIAGAVFLAANARHIEDISIAQTEFMLKAKGGASPDEQRRLDLMKAQAERIRHLDPAGQNPQILLGLPLAYFLDLKSYDPPAAAAKLGVPLLFLQGERDFQVTMEDFSLWKTGLAASKQASFRTYPALNHLFISGEGPGSPAEYRKPGNVAPSVVDDIAQWLSTQKRKDAI